MITLALGFLACTGPQPGYDGTNMTNYFPIDGARESSFRNDDTSIEWTLAMKTVQPVETIDGRRVVTYELTNDDTGEVLGAVKWSASDDVLIHAWRSGTDEWTEFDTPVVFAEESMNLDETVETTTNGSTFTATRHEIATCDVVYGDSFDNCIRVTLDDGDGDDAAGPIFAGEYWLAGTYGVARMTTTGWSQAWSLSDHEYSAE